ncbi:MAG TPA: hypothetical protein VHY30_02610 [Verrucomicrobiae bacterium]|jgi:hypothetical protein|nr:hypothetical protein [Verrucomicrobiae bacterium]
MEQMRKLLEEAIQLAFKQLLSEKHLYQYVEVDIGFISTVAETVQKGMGAAILSSDRTVKRTTLDDAKKYCVEQTAVIWCPSRAITNTINFQSGLAPILFELPTINTFCNHCDGSPPFNPVAENSFLAHEARQDKIYLLGYQCQQCKGQPIYFLVCREGLKLRLAGRYPLEVLPTPKVLPKSVSKYYGNAMIAHHAGQTLAGLFLLRVFIEQFWRIVPAVKELVALQPKATGDEQGDAYQSKLPQDFNSRFPSLKDIYGKLSAAIHSADENAALFDDSCVKIEKHFEARRLFEIGN